MNKKRSEKPEQRGDDQAGANRPRDGTAPQCSSTRRFTPIAIGLAVVAVALGTALFMGLSGRDNNSSVAKDTGNATTPIATTPVVVPPVTATPLPSTPATAWPGATQPAVTGLPPAPTGPQSPINNVDPVTNEPITARSPTIVYKGHVVAFCCRNSKGLNGGWERMSEAEKDAFVKRWIK